MVIYLLRPPDPPRSPCHQHENADRDPHHILQECADSADSETMTAKELDELEASPKSLMCAWRCVTVVSAGQEVRPEPQQIKKHKV